ncbi:MAG: hypothetical protein PVG56_00315 [Anaerolineae bacterium]|jgi:hypothetical protein
MNRARVLQAGLVLLPLLLAGLALVGLAWAGSSDGATVQWSVLSGGGAPAASSSGAVSLNGTLGQTAIGPSSVSGSSFGPGTMVGAGFWYGLGEGVYEIYLPLTLRNH